MATMAGAFGGLLARLIQLMDGTAGLQGWRWIFILEGILTVVVACAALYVPLAATALTPQLPALRLPRHGVLPHPD